MTRYIDIRDSETTSSFVFLFLNILILSMFFILFPLLVIINSEFLPDATFIQSKSVSYWLKVFIGSAYITYTTFNLFNTSKSIIKNKSIYFMRISNDIIELRMVSGWFKSEKLVINRSDINSIVYEILEGKKKRSAFLKGQVSLVQSGITLYKMKHDIYNDKELDRFSLFNIRVLGQ